MEKGIVHAEMPASKEKESIGFQLWLNLENKNRFVDPQYQEFTKDKIPLTEVKGAKVKVIAGDVLGVIYINLYFL